MNLELINAWTDDEARASFLRCCGSRQWALEMTDARPFGSEASVFETAARIWWRLSEADWLEAFAAHPRIGDLEAIRAKFATTVAWTSREQAGAINAPDEVLQNLARRNGQYEERFGFIFIVCATGKTAEEMLAILNKRLANDPEAELRLAAEEQMKITTIRLKRVTS